MITGYKNVNPILVAEPFQASQGDEVPTSPKDLQDYYDDMEKRDLERKQSRGKSRRWTLRGSNKGGDKGNDKKVLEHGEPNRKQSSLSEQVSEHHGGQAQITGRHTPPLADHPYDASNESRSSVSELRMDDLVPSPWSYEPPEHVTSRIAPPSTYRTYYKIHNPVGPRFYRNHHLRPLNHSTFAAASRPASAFSSAFPPLAALPPGSPPPRGLGLGRAQLHPHNNPPQFPSPHTSFSSSESVLPTPESSENAFPGPGGETSRKNNNDVVNGTVVADPVDQLDGSNPYGQRFHHDSPYDLGKKGKGNEQGPRNGTLVAGASSVTDLKPPRSRMSVQLPRKTTPSPLSQSTSAINIQSEGEGVVVRKRKLSKRRVGGLKGLFGPSPSPDQLPVGSRAPSPPLADPPPVNHTLSVSSPVIPKGSKSNIKHSHLSVPAPLTRKLSKSSKPTNHSTGSLASIAPARPPSLDKGGKTASVLGRIAKRFSMARKPESSIMAAGRHGVFDKGKGKESIVSLTETDKVLLDGTRKSDVEPGPDGERPHEPRRSTDFLKRVPPPPLEPESSQSASAARSSPKDAPPTSQPTVVGSALPSIRSSVIPQLPDLTTGAGLGILRSHGQDDSHVRDSLASLEPEANWRLGKLTIANPDLPGGSETDSVTVRGEGDALSSPRVGGVSHLYMRDERTSFREDKNAGMSIRGDGDVRVSRQGERDVLGRMSGSGSTSPRDGKDSALPPIPPMSTKGASSESGVTDETPRASVVDPPPQPKLRAPSPDLPPPPKLRAPSPEFPPPPKLRAPSPEFPPPPKLRAPSPELPPPPKLRAPSPELPPPPKLRAPSPELPPPPTHDRSPSERQKSLPQIEKSQAKSGLPPRPDVFPAKPEPSLSKLQPALPRSEPSTALVDPSPLEASSSSYPRPSRHVRQREEHEYYIDVPLEGSLFSRTAPVGGGSVPPVEKPTLPPLPPKSKYREGTERSYVAGQPLQPSSKESTVFTSIFATPSRSRHTSESSPNEGSSHGHGYTPAPAPLQRSRGHVRTGSYSPDKPAARVYVRAGSESPDKEGRRERVRERHYERERQQDHRAAGKESDPDNVDRVPQRVRERHESSARRQDRESSDRERDRWREEREREKWVRDREDRDRTRDRELVEERERDKNRGREREKAEEYEKDREMRQREREREDRERKKERERAEKEREIEHQREKEREREKAKEREKEREREKAKERENEREREKAKEREKEREREKAKEREKEREREKAKERDREREKARERERDAQRERERERERQKEKDRREREKEKERGQEREREREKEKEGARERERQEREREKEKAREREREREKQEREQERQKEKERVRRKEQETQVERETVKYRFVPRHRTSSMTASSSYQVPTDSRMDSSTDDEDWEVVERRRNRKYKGGSAVREKRENGYGINSATFPRRSSMSQDASQSTDRVHRDSQSGERGSEARTRGSFQPSYRRPRPRAYSLETPHSRASSTRPPSPEDITSSRRQEDNQYFQTSSFVPTQRTANALPRLDPRSASTPYIAPRPSSGFLSPDWSQFKAKEAWERDRMWRGHSMTFTPDMRSGGSTTSPSAPAHSNAWGSVGPHDQPVSYGQPPSTFYPQPPPAHHGSSYTSFMVQPTWSYAQYSQPAPTPAPVPSFSLQSSSNPLPPPPRQSAFDTRTPPRSASREAFL